MAIEKPAKVPQAKISSLDIVSFNGGLDQRGEENITPNSFAASRNAMVNEQGLITHRYGLRKWLPDLIETVYQVFPALYNNELFYITADDGQIKYCQSGDPDWTPAGGAYTNAAYTTALTGTNNDLVYTANPDNKLTRGTEGNEVTIAYVNAGASKPLLVTVVNKAISVQLATNGSSVITSTANDVLAAIQASVEASTLVTVALAGGNDGSGVVTALTATNLTGGAGTNLVTTGDGVVITFIRVLDKVLILNGVDELGYLDLSNMNVAHYDAVTDPASAPTASPTVLTNSGSFKIYYSITFNSVVGTTKNSPILTYTVNKSRETWKADGTEYLTISRNNSAPTGAVSWNLYLATAPSGASIQDIDMLPLATGLDLAQTSFVDNGSLAANLSAGSAPSDNSTKGPKAKYGVEIEGRPFLFGITDDEYALCIGGNGEHATDFSPTNGGYRLVLNQGTNYYPQSVVGFRNGQGIPSITVLFSNTQGLSKQSIVEQQTITYGDISFVVWGSTEQNYGAAGVGSPYGVVNYKGALHFPSTDGFVKMDTQASIQNVLSTSKISNPIINEVSTIKNNRLNAIVGTAWNDRVLWVVSARGFNTNNEILIYDSTNKNLPIWYTFEIPAQWIGTISPRDEPAFIYVCQGNHVFRLQKSYVALDEDSSGVTAPFPVSVTTGLIGTNAAHTGYYAVVQVMFYLTNFIGSVDVTVRYRDQEGEWQTITDTITNGAYAQSSGGNWSSSGYRFQGDTDVLTWGETDKINDVENSQKDSIRYPIPIDDITNELQVTMAVNLTNSAFVGRSVSFEGQPLGISPDIR